MKNNKTYPCKLCGLIYSSKQLANKCAKFCGKNNACSIEITKHSIGELK